MSLVSRRNGHNAAVISVSNHNQNVVALGSTVLSCFSCFSVAVHPLRFRTCNFEPFRSPVPCPVLPMNPSPFRQGLLVIRMHSPDHELHRAHLNPCRGTPDLRRRGTSHCFIAIPSTLRLNYFHATNIRYAINSVAQCSFDPEGNPRYHIC